MCPKPRRSFRLWMTRSAGDELNRYCRQHSVATGWSADLTTQPTCTAEEPMQTSQHRQQTGCRSSPACRAETCAPRGTLHVRRVAASEPLISRARPPEVWRARGHWTAASATMPKKRHRVCYILYAKKLIRSLPLVPLPATRKVVTGGYA